MKNAIKVTGKEIKEFVQGKELPIYMQHNQRLPNQPERTNWGTWLSDPKSPAQVAQWITDIHKLIQETGAAVRVEVDKIIIQYQGTTTGKATIKRDIITDRYLVPFIAQ